MLNLVDYTDVQKIVFSCHLINVSKPIFDLLWEMISSMLKIIHLFNSKSIQSSLPHFQCSSWNSYFGCLWPFTDDTSCVVNLCPQCIFPALPNWKTRDSACTKSNFSVLKKVIVIFFTQNFSFEIFKTKWYSANQHFTFGLLKVFFVLHNDLILSMTSFCFSGQNFTAYFFESQHYFLMTRASISYTCSWKQMAYHICINFTAVIKTVQLFCSFELSSHCLKHIVFWSIHIYTVCKRECQHLRQFCL